MFPPAVITPVVVSVDTPEIVPLLIMIPLMVLVVDAEIVPALLTLHVVDPPLCI